jgi:uncharacterized protein YndB with AHSA1/START domain
VPESGVVVTKHSVEVGVTIAAPPETVFRFFADPAWFMRWMGDGAEIEPRPGGTLQVRYPQGQVASGHIVELDPPRRIVFTWGFLAAPTALPGETELVPPGSMTVEVTLTSVTDGTRVTLRHRDIPNQDMAWGAKQGWRYALSVLANRASEAHSGGLAITGRDGSPQGSGTNFAELTPTATLRHVVGFWDSPSP